MSISKLLLIFGGRSSEHEISLRSASEVLAAVDRSRYQLELLGIRRDGSWCSGSLETPLASIIAEGAEVREPAQRLRGSDVVFPLLHGPYGEDGTLQGMLEVHDVPYVGSSVLASSLCMDKAAFKHCVRASPHGIPVVPDLVINLLTESIESAEARAREAIADRLGWPCFVKPANQGSSVGVSKVIDATGLASALALAARFDDKILIEQGIDGREIELAVLGDGGPDTLVSTAGEIVLPKGVWYDYAAKYEDDVATLSLPAELPNSLVDRLRALALQAFRATDCHGLARVDFFVDRSTGTPYLNEVNTMPGFTSISMYPKLMNHAGVPYGELVTRLCELAVRRHRRKAGRSTQR